MKFFEILIMNINDKFVLEMLNKLIALDRLDKNQILQIVDLASISNDIHDLVFVMVKCTFIDSDRKCMILSF